jgi:hypothetical protein
MECSLAGGIEVLGENLPQRHFCPSQNPTWPDPDLNPGRRGGKPATNGLSYDATKKYINLIGIRNFDLLACSVVPQPTTLPHDPNSVL